MKKEINKSKAKSTKEELMKLKDKNSSNSHKKKKSIEENSTMSNKA